MKANKYLYSLLVALLFPLALWANANYIIINQVMYDTPLAEEVGKQGCYNGEFFELYNGGKDDVALNGWQVHSLSGTNTCETYSLPRVIIPSGGYLIFASRYEDGDTFEMDEFYEQLVNKPHPDIIYNNKIILSNKKETLLLINAQKDTVDQIVFGSNTNLKASNSNGTLGKNCRSLHRTGVECDEYGHVIKNKSQWVTDKVSFGKVQLPNPKFGVNNIISSASLTAGSNYIMTITPLDETSNLKFSDEGISIDANVRVKATIQYYDGLGRPNELVAVGVTPSKKDLVSTTTYSGLHRATKQYLPMPMDTKGTYTDIATAQQEAKSYFGDNRPFTESLYENSALERVIGQKRPGTSCERHRRQDDQSCQ